jgi:hypothetical protein
MSEDNQKNRQEVFGSMFPEGEKMNSKVEDFLKKSPKYDPSKHYKWEPTSVFALSGEEYGVLLNSLRAILNSPEGRLITLVQSAHEGIVNALARAVEVGQAVETVAPPPKKA